MELHEIGRQQQREARSRLWRPDHVGEIEDAEVRPRAEVVQARDGLQIRYDLHAEQLQDLEQESVQLAVRIARRLVWIVPIEVRFSRGTFLRNGF